MFKKKDKGAATAKPFEANKEQKNAILWLIKIISPTDDAQKAFIPTVTTFLGQAKVAGNFFKSDFDTEISKLTFKDDSILKNLAKIFKNIPTAEITILNDLCETITSDKESVKTFATEVKKAFESATQKDAAEKAEEQVEAKETEISEFTKRKEAAEKKLETATKALETAKTEAEAADEKLKKANDDLETAKKEPTEKKIKIESLISDAKKIREESQSQVKQAEADLEKAKKDKAEAEKTQTTTKKEAESLQQQIKQLEAKVTSLKTEKVESEEKITDLAKNLAALTEEKSKLDAQIKSDGEAKAEKEKALAPLRAQAADLKKDLQDQTTEKSKLDAQIKADGETKSEKEKAFAPLRTQADGLKKDLQDQTTEKSKLDAQIKADGEAKAENEKALAPLRAQAADLKKDLQIQATEKSGLEAQIKTGKAAQTKNADELKDLEKQVGELKENLKTYNKAVEATTQEQIDKLQPKQDEAKKALKKKLEQCKKLQGELETALGVEEKKESDEKAKDKDKKKAEKEGLSGEKTDDTKKKPWWKDNPIYNLVKRDKGTAQQGATSTTGFISIAEKAAYCLFGLLTTNFLVSFLPKKFAGTAEFIANPLTQAAGALAIPALLHYGNNKYASSLSNQYAQHAATAIAVVGSATDIGYKIYTGQSLETVVKGLFSNTATLVGTAAAAALIGYQSR